ncbi:hypothetical protein ANN_11427 [Periplaneta americana]|uniref:Uncharacterized protein n=1 Tax=Periplaneta americana TaxID=6978 RepID=A0ABQ8T6F0_PERAM|nr:hypothetical protein ANN_11427 [Periplaneta americana]
MINMWTQQQKVQCVLWLAEDKSVTLAQRRVLCRWIGRRRPIAWPTRKCIAGCPYSGKSAIVMQKSEKLNVVMENHEYRSNSGKAEYESVTGVLVALCVLLLVDCIRYQSKSVTEITLLKSIESVPKTGLNERGCILKESVQRSRRKLRQKRKIKIDCNKYENVGHKDSEDSFHQWSKLKSKGLGVVFYSHWKKGNSWISNKKGLSSSQWTQAIKMNCNTIPVRTLPGRTLDSTRCRRCVLGFCHHGELLRINRHNTVRSLIAASIRQNASYEFYEEVGCVSSDGSTRRADIIIIDRQKDKGVILDPTIRFEMHEQQPQEVCREKQVIYMSHVVSILEHNTTLHIGQFLGSCSVPMARSHVKL